MTSGFQCASCGEWNETSVDQSAGSKQSYVEDCQVCCRPNVLTIWWETDLGQYVVSAQLESE
jgi:Cysteine-rich CPXCG